MKKMLVILLILFTKALADSYEDKYIDLLSDEEKQQFLENVARRIFNDVEIKKTVTGAQSGEVSDDQLNEHNEYVKSIIKDEQRSVKNEDDVNDQKSKSASEEIEVLGVQPLGTENTSLQDEQVSNESGSKNITDEDVTDNAPMIKRSVKHDNTSKIVQSDENSETLQTISENNSTSEETNELEAENDKFLNENNASNAKVLEPIGGHEVDESVSVQSNQTDDALNLSVKAIHESRRTNNDDGKLVENTTDIDTTTSTAEVVKSTETKPAVYTNVSRTEEELTTLTYPFESSSLKGNTTEGTTLDGILFESTTELTKKENDSESLLKSKNDSIKDSENKVVTNITNSTRTSVNEELTESVPETTESVKEATESIPETTKSVTKVTEPVAETTESVTKATEPVPETTESTKPVSGTTESVTETSKPVIESTEPVSGTTESVTETSKPVIESTEPVSGTTESVTETSKPVIESTEPVSGTRESVTETSKPVIESTEPVSGTTESVTETSKPVIESTEPVSGTTESVTETTKPVIATTKSVTESTEFVPETKTKTGIVTTEAPTESTSALFTTHFIPVAKMNITVEDFTSAPTSGTTVKSTKLEPRTTTETEKMAFTKQIVFSEKLTPAALESDEESVKPKTKKRIRHKVIVHKPVKYIVGPKAKKMAEANDDDAQIDNFIELEKVYYDNHHTQHRGGNQYQVFEIPGDQSPFTKVEAPAANQPYYVPVYNYAPINAYFNPENRLGPNAEDSSAEKDTFRSIFNDDEGNNLDETVRLNVKMQYDEIYENKRKKFGSNHNAHGIQKQPTQKKETQKSRGNINPEDYFDSDFYFGRLRKRIARNSDLSKFPNSNEADHPAHSMGEGTLKDHIRAVRNILFLQKSFGLIDDGSVERTSRRNKELRRKNSINNHIQKVGYLKKQNLTKELYVIDDLYKANFEKFIEQQALTLATPQPYIDAEKDEVFAFLRKDFRMHKAGKNRNNKMNKKYLTNIKETVKTKPDQDDLPVNRNDDNVTKNLKLGVTKNEVVTVSVYLQVLKDMVALDNKALVQFDWLGTTVDIQAALQKLFELNALVTNAEDVHPSDMEILKYVLFIHKLATEIVEANEVGAKLRKKLALPRNKKKLKQRVLKEKGLINRVWMYLRSEVPEVNDNEALKQLNSFFIAVEDGLYDLHDAIKNVATITKYKNQHWYQNLKDLYISTGDKHLLQLLLHMAAMRLFTLIEESAMNGLEDDYIKYMKKNRKHCKRTLEQMLFIMEIFKEYNKYVE